MVIGKDIRKDIFAQKRMGKSITVLFILITLNMNLTSQTKKKPQEPERPFPYVEKDVSFKNAVDGTTLYGTLTLPDENNKYPAVVLVTGSGPQNRDEEILGHKPFLVIADYLTRSGFAVLRYDDRHLNMPVTEGWKFTTFDLANDTKAAVQFLRANKNIQSNFIGIIGHSEGGVIAPIVASEDKHIAFVVSLAGTGLSGYQIALNQGKDLAIDSKEEEFSKKSLEVIVNEPDIVVRKKKIKQIHHELYGWFHFKARKTLKSTIDMTVSEWNRQFIMFDPTTAWCKVTCPALALNGEHDIQVHPAENLQAIEKALNAAGNKDFLIKIIPKANHLFQEVKNGGAKDYNSLIAEYQQSEQTISPEVLKIIKDWLLLMYEKNSKSL